MVLKKSTGLGIKKYRLKRQWLLNPVSMFILGLLAGIGCRVLDLNPDTKTFGVIFSQVNIWVLLCVLISIYSPSPSKAMSNVFPFCINMLVAYYLYDSFMGTYTSLRAYLWWSGLAVVTPLLGYCAWYAKEVGVIPRLLRWGILITSIVANIVMFKDFAYYDIIITAVLAYFLFCQKLDRAKMRRKYITHGLYGMYTLDEDIFNELVSEHVQYLSAQRDHTANADNE